MIDGAYFRISLWIVLKILAILLINKAIKASANHFFQRLRVMICIFSGFSQDFLKISNNFSKFPRFFSTSPIFSPNFHSSPGFPLQKKDFFRRPRRIPGPLETRRRRPKPSRSPWKPWDSHGDMMGYMGIYGGYLWIYWIIYRYGMLGDSQHRSISPHDLKSQSDETDDDWAWEWHPPQQLVSSWWNVQKIGHFGRLPDVNVSKDHEGHHCWAFVPWANPRHRQDTMPLFHDALWRVTAIDIEYTLAKVMQRVLSSVTDIETLERHGQWVRIMITG